MSANLDKLRAIMREMFQLDQAELDFGIYRIMNQKRDEIEKFLDKDLLPQVEAAFSDFGSTAKETLVDELDKMKVEIERLGYVAEDNPKYMEKKAALAKAVDVTALENEVFSHLANFFRRYYQGGDFLSLRRYKAGVYAIPYEGEEVKLHWANADQYYIKSSENFRDYTFKLQSGKKVHFKLIEASTEQNNKKEQTGKERRFILTDETPLMVDNGELYIRFEYRIADEKGKQTALNDAAVQTVLAITESDWKRELSSFAPTEKNPRRTLLEKHLNDYTAKFTFDYFIHKDLGGFMRRELDFFIKNEVLFIDDLDADHVKSSIAKVKVIKGIGHKIIAFLEQLENFQKKLWLKKKFVVETGYCCTLDKVPEELYPAIIANTAQIEKWKELFSIQDIEGDLHTPMYSDPLTVEILKANPFLVLDTALFDRDFTEKLLSSFDNLDESTDGLLLHGDNFQGMNLLNATYSEEISCVFTDPPYNTGVDGFPYKDTYQHSSWIAMMNDRLKLCKSLLSKTGIFFATIDFVEVSNLRLLCDDVFGKNNFLADIAWEKRYTRSNNAKKFYSLKDTIITYRASESLQVLREGRTEKSRSNYSNPDNDSRGDWISSSYVNPARKEDRQNLVYPITNSFTKAVINHPTHAWKYDKDTHSRHVSENRLYWGLDGTYEYPRLKSFWSEASDGMVPIDVWGYRETGTTDDGGNAVKALFGDAVFDNPKPTSLIQRALKLDANEKQITLDFFAGSGTTGHAVINQNREDESKHKYILVEMGDHFDTVLKPRIQKVIYSKDWKDGKPLSRQGSSHMFKYICLESYEDALNNLQLKSTDAQQSLLTHNDKLREEYMLSYMLDVESHGSASLLDTDSFKDPFGYKMKIARGNETKDTTVDLLETFNYLLGIKVLRISASEKRTADFERDGEGRLQIKGKPRSCAAGEGWMFREVEGTTLVGEKVLIIWRTLSGNAEEDNLLLDSYFSKRNYSTLDFEFSRIYVNGDNNLENLKIGEEQWKVALIEQEFKRLMFDVEGI